MATPTVDQPFAFNRHALTTATESRRRSVRRSQFRREASIQLNDLLFNRRRGIHGEGHPAGPPPLCPLDADCVSFDVIRGL